MRKPVSTNRTMNNPLLKSMSPENINSNILVEKNMPIPRRNADRKATKIE
jgi:hypothetical protein